MGMTGKDITKFFFIAFLAILCLVVISLMWPTFRTRRAEVKEEGVLVPQERRAGDRDAQKAFEYEKRKRITETEEEGEVPLTPKPLEYPEPPTPFVEEPGIWSEVRDEAPNVLEEQPLYYALHQINSMTQDQIEKRVKEDGDLTEAEYGTNPAKYRGKFVSIAGTLIELEERDLPTNNRSGLNQIWVGTLYNQRNKKFRKYFFYVARKDMDYVTQTYCRAKELSRNGDAVRLDGVFVKLYRTEIEGAGGGTVIYPFIIGRELVIIKEPTYTELYPWGAMSVVAAIIGGIFVVIFFAVRRDIKGDKKFKREMHEKLKKRIDDEFIKTHSKRHKIDIPGECTKEEPGSGPDPRSPETPAPPKPQNQS